ncbi:HAD family hydrolase [Sphingomonas lenta]|uniref:HAD family hydrolase n=1 Tax=Sphingomonas lenta TaxID=1141887 RepID=A0A2A2SBM1_9SPHN|nr:HAD family hydrolase [Sphingomonas lenta]PAX06658.1 HAD family hydrolase [Sphingomonas lenta]
MPIRAILFDIDGTLVDSNDLHVDAWLEAFERHGHRFTRDQVREQIGKGGDMLVPALLPDLPEDEQEKLADAHGEAFQGARLQQVQPFPGAHDLVARVKQAGLKVALASSAAQAELDHYLDLLAIRDLVDETTTTDDVENSKPAPDVVATALKKLGLGAHEVLFVGDTPYDIQSGAKCGVATVAVLSGGFPRETLKGAKAIYNDAAALAAAWPAWVERS